MKLKHHHQKRGPRYRQERRQLKRTGIPMTTAVEASEFAKMVDEIDLEPIKPEGSKCPKCGASGEERCRTLTTGKVTDRHAGRDIL